MAVSKVIIIGGLIGFLSGLVSNHPITRRSENTQYLLPRTLVANDALDIKLINTNYFVIRLMTAENKIVYTFTVNLHDDDAEMVEESDSGFILKTSYNKFIENSTIAVNFTVMRSTGTELTNVVSIGGPAGVIKDITIKDITDIEEIKYLTITGAREADVKLLELKVTFN